MKTTRIKKSRDAKVRELVAYLRRFMARGYAEMDRRVK